MTPVLVITGAEDPKTVKPVQDTPVEQVAEEVATLYIEEPLPARIAPRVVEPVPPLVTGRVPETSVPSATCACEDTTPLLLVLRKPDGEPETTRLVVEA